MGRSDVCGNDDEKTMMIITPGRKGAFDARYFGCANCGAPVGIPERQVNP
jgi:hypothetical protein